MLASGITASFLGQRTRHRLDSLQLEEEQFSFVTLERTIEGEMKAKSSPYLIRAITWKLYIDRNLAFEPSLA